MKIFGGWTERRLSGQLETDELLKLTQVDRRLIQRTALRATNDFQMVNGAGRS